MADLNLHTASVKIHGKGGKQRYCPLWTATVAELTILVADALSVILFLDVLLVSHFDGCARLTIGSPDAAEHAVVLAAVKDGSAPLKRWPEERAILDGPLCATAASGAGRGGRMAPVEQKDGMRGVVDLVRPSNPASDAL